MTVAPPGYLRPEVRRPLSPDEDAMIAAVCPGLGLAVEAGGRPESDLWGPVIATRTGWATEDALRHGASSGGVLSAVLAHLLRSGAVDAVIQTAADPDLAIGNATVVSDTPEAVARAAGSRYAPSAPLDGLLARIADGRRYAFVGKPCDAAALRAIAQRDSAVAAAVPVILSFFCAGIPSHAGGREVLKALGTDLDSTAAFRFRGNGWPGRATATLKDGGERSMSYNDSWGKILTRHIQHRCKICADGSGMSADLVCADAWEADADGYPVFEEAEGASLIVARTPLGQALMAEVERAGAIATRPFDTDGIARMQPGQVFRRSVVLARLAALRLAGRPVPRYRGLRLWAAMRHGSARVILRNFLGMFRRLPPRPRP
ncbi:MAG: Coenzyme F420 hydrogenase/dehydrogenase, beta subunit C-terminal domain [Pseudomonadota bacterium]